MKVIHVIVLNCDYPVVFYNIAGKMKTISWTENLRIIPCSVFQAKTYLQIRVMRCLFIPLLLFSYNPPRKCRSH